MRKWPLNDWVNAKRLKHMNTLNMGLISRKHVFGVSNKVRFQPPQLQRIARQLKLRLKQL